MDKLLLTPVDAAAVLHYTHVVPELAQDAAQRMAQALWGEPS